MASTAERLLLGDPPDPRRHARRFVGGFAVLVLAGYGLFALATRPPLDAVVGSRLAEWLFAAVTFYAPPLAAAASALRRGGLLVAAAVGVIPALAFGAVASLLALVVGPTGDGSPWGLALAFAVFGLVGALAGYAAVTVSRVAVRASRGG